MDTFQLITIKSPEPFIRGLQYGQQAEALIHLGIEGYQRHFSKALDLTWKDITEKSRLYLDLLEREFPEELEEARGIAEGSSVPLEDILALNCRYEILKYRPHECTTGAILPVVSADRCSTFLIQNWDYRPWVERHAVVVSIDDEKGTHIVGVTEAGQLVRNGMNSWGVGLCANNLTSVFDTGDVGAPVTFVRRKALNSRSFSQLCSTVRSSRRGVSCNFMLASSDGKAVDLEATPGGVFEVAPSRGLVTHANHMVAGAPYCTNQGTKFRDQILRRVLEKMEGQIDLPAIQAALRDHETFPGAPDTYPEASCIEAVCSHVPHGSYDEDKVWKTISSSIYHLNAGKAYICKGCPCEGTYVPYEV